MIKAGYTGKLIEINLTTKKSKERYIQEDFSLRYIGGRGFGARLVWDLTDNKTQPYSPDNIICIAAGPLTGLLAPGSSKTAVVSLSPATNIYGDSNIGSRIGFELKKAGYDILLLKGKANKPIIVMLKDADIEFQNAEGYWGMGARESEAEIKKDLKDIHWSVATIGSAGENLVNFAVIQSENRVAGRTGMGAILGSKNVKAITIKGTKSVKVANPDKLIETFQRANDYLKSHPIADVYAKFGTFGLLEGVNDRGILPVHNFQDAIFEDVNKLGMDKFDEKFPNTKSQTCLYCPVSCEGVLKKSNQLMLRPQYETLVMFGPNLGISDLDNVIESNHFCNEYGLDTISSGNIIGLVMELFQRKILTQKDLNGIECNFGDCAAVHKLLEIITKREGIGNILADGIKAIIKKWPASERYALHSKGLEQSGYDTRALKAMTLAYATSDIGAHHNRAWTAYHELTKKRTNKELAELVMFHQHIRPLMDCLGVCRFPWIEFDINIELYGDFYKYGTGVNFNIKDLIHRSEGIYNLTRAINVRRGISRKDDQPPQRVYEDPIPKGPFKGKKIDKNEFQKLLDIYYNLRGWDSKGIPTFDTLKKFGLEDIAKEIYNKELK
ncbi:MAG: aldehyde ferredoxin oxidoreductase family protein [Candidatus Helarchaeota archaeon]|nr:aldehyde ferredoxin oxidoreductase family protein [Candidatus Helarchaeota archaeon]